MQLTASKNYLEERLPERVIKKLYKLAQKYADRGIQLFVFGSFANASDRKTSDLDIGVLWTNERSSKAFSELYSDILELPTIRKIDLVDMQQVDKFFKRKIMSKKIILLDEAGIDG